tara:strand:- start:3747 stop:3968 length:222 start_codon:yes stop_codon:yes gene_type:complete
MTSKKCTASKMCRMRFMAPIDIENKRRELESEVGELLREALTQVLTYIKTTEKAKIIDWNILKNNITQPFLGR